MPSHEPVTDADLATAVLDAARGVLLCAGSWTVHGIPGMHQRLEKLAWPRASELTVDCAGIVGFDTGGAWLLADIAADRARAGQQLQLENLRPEYLALVRLVQARMSSTTLPAPPSPMRSLELLGAHAWQSWQQVRGMLRFMGESAVATARGIRHPRHWRGRAILHNLQHAGFDALPIVGLLAFLIGTVIAYQAATQLARYGANIFIADLVGHSVLRELAPLIVAIIVAGRSGSAYAAQIGTMKVTEEIDAMRTMGLSPHEILVVPKMVALIIALPLLTVYADIVGVAGGLLVAYVQLDVDAFAFFDRFDDTIRVSTFLFGVGKAPVFGYVIAMVGCFQGFQATGSADSVGRQTTVSVVQAIFLIIVVDAVFSVLASVTNLGFR